MDRDVLAATVTCVKEHANYIARIIIDLVVVVEELLEFGPGGHQVAFL